MSRPASYKKRVANRDHVCTICGAPILAGETYIDGGVGSKLHTECDDKVEAARVG
jgi:hypothetical protein